MRVHCAIIIEIIDTVIILLFLWQSSCPNLTQAWPGRESDASVRHFVCATYVILRKITSAVRDQSENREHKFTLRKHEDRHLV